VSNITDQYNRFLIDKINIAPETGLDKKVDLIEFKDNTRLLPHQRDAINWAIKGGNRALFESFGLGKTIQQLIIISTILKHENGLGLIICPLGVRQEFKIDAEQKLGIEIHYVRTLDECKQYSDGSILITNYERVRDGDIDPNYFKIISLDEASVLRSYGTKTYQEFLKKFQQVKYKFVATATPSPNKFKELIHYAGFLGIMQTGEALTRFFKRDSTKANKLTLHPHKEQEFWFWLSTWALFITKPSDLGYSDVGYDLPPMKVIYHEINVDHSTAKCNPDGQYKMFRNAAISLKDAMHEKHDNMANRVAKMKEIIDNDPNSHYIIWHDLESERHAIKKILPEAVEVYGSQDIDKREQRIIDFSNGKFKYLATKPVISGSGCNFQRHCHKAIFLGIGYKFNDFIQAIHRIYRFLQTEQVEIHIIYAESEVEILKVLQKKWENYKKLVTKMTDIIKEHGLSSIDVKEKLKRTINMERVEVKGKTFTAVMSDTIYESDRLLDNSIDLIVTSIPFSNHYEYTPTYNDFGHTQNDDHFFAQMDFLTPNLYRILQPGRICAVHVKDRILFGNVTKYGMPSVNPFHMKTTFHFLKYGFIYMGMITIETDVVRENNQTYRLGWTEQCKDGSKMGIGSPEYILLFRKLPTDTSKGYADIPVRKNKKEYPRGRWQIDARAKWNSSGNRFLTLEEIAALPIDTINAYFSSIMENTIYDFNDHKAIAEMLEKIGKLPATFETLKVSARTDYIWSDINRMLTLNSSQSKKNQEMHICLATGSLILTCDGYKEIQNINIGDLVLTHKGNWMPVTAKKCTGNNETVKVKAQGVPNLVLTPSHKLWARKNNKVCTKDYLSRTNPDWIKAEDTKGAWINLKLPPIEQSMLTENEWWIVGRYLADGHIDVRNDFFISVGKHKKEEFEKYAANYIGTFAINDALQYRLKNLSINLKAMLLKCGKGALNKQVPIEGLCLNVQKSEALLSGYLSGDGNTTGNQTSASSISRALLLGMSIVAQRARNVIASVYASKKAGKYNILGREVDQHQLWVMSWRISSHHSFGKILDDGAWKKVDKIENNGTAETWSLQVAGDESYTAEGCIVKNCPLQFDIVERLIERYSNKGELVFDPFAGLMTVPYMAIKMERKGYGVELNPVSFRDGIQYLRAAEIQAQTPDLFSIMEENQ